MKPLLLFVLAISLINTLVNAKEVYRCVDEHGQTELTEKECEGGEKITLPAPQTYTPAPSEKKFTYTPPGQKTDITRYDEITITSPANDATLRDVDGKVSVTTSVSPALKTGFGHRLQLILDENPTGEAGVSPSFMLTGVERGTHTLKVLVMDEKGNTLAESATITFHLQRFSKLIQEQRIEQQKQKDQQKQDNSSN